MPREGTRSQTGNATPRVFKPVDTAPVITRKKSAKVPKIKTKPVVAVKPTGVTKNKAPKKDGVITKAKATVKKVTKKVAQKTGAVKATKPKAATSPEPVPAAA
ncbi:histone transcription regulator [Ophiostoma piceae UAMH 11346]|uniref:Histone transcription regulator n=1 Tax=Ophiostoma piceae (strain UAMH 11346) TaxID=1262450 RepID=S3C4L6_OPHP1|nr:histone transcription regulator [Ophiostoma piceae UAMH 11346]